MVAHHTVSPGDTLSAIARANSSSVQAIVRANPHITDPNRVAVGTVLHVPPVPVAPEPTPEPEPPTPEPPVNGIRKDRWLEHGINPVPRPDGFIRFGHTMGPRDKSSVNGQEVLMPMGGRRSYYERELPRLPIHAVDTSVSKAIDLWYNFHHTDPREADGKSRFGNDHRPFQEPQKPMAFLTMTTTNRPVDRSAVHQAMIDVYGPNAWPGYNKYWSARPGTNRQHLASILATAYQSLGMDDEYWALIGQEIETNPHLRSGDVALVLPFNHEANHEWFAHSDAYQAELIQEAALLVDPTVFGALAAEKLREVFETGERWRVTRPAVERVIEILRNEAPSVTFMTDYGWAGAAAQADGDGTGGVDRYPAEALPRPMYLDSYHYDPYNRGAGRPVYKGGPVEDFASWDMTPFSAGMTIMRDLATERGLPLAFGEIGVLWNDPGVSPDISARTASDAQSMIGLKYLHEVFIPSTHLAWMVWFAVNRAKGSYLGGSYRLSGNTENPASMAGNPMPLYREYASRFLGFPPESY